MSLKPTYDGFKAVWEDTMKKWKTEMLEFENQHNDDVEFNDIKLNRVATCADGWTKHFWVSIHVDLYGNLMDEPMETRYYLETKPNSVLLRQEMMNEGFSQLWNLPDSVEYDLIKAILKDVVEEYENCFLDEFTAPAFSRLFEDVYLSQEQFSEEARMRYYQKYGEDSMLTAEAKEMFLF